MGRTNLTSNKRAFRRNPRSFLDKITKQPLSITIDDGVTSYEVLVSPTTGTVLNSDDLPPSVSIKIIRDTDILER